jgi:hypothetical protein
MYGVFLSITSLMIWLGYRWQPSIFSEHDVRLWQIFLYTADIGVRGFIKDFMEWADYRILTPLGVMRYVAALLKIVMAVTVISGAAKYYDLTKGKETQLPR